MKKVNLVIAGILLAFVVSAQTPVTWSFTSKKISEGKYEVKMIAEIQSGWNIYSQSTPEGGPLPTFIEFNKNPLLTFSGTAKEEGKQLKKHEELFGVDVLYFKDRVEFVQTVELKKKAKTSVTGYVEFMACNNVQCLPPKKQPFTVKLN